MTLHVLDLDSVLLEPPFAKSSMHGFSARMSEATGRPRSMSTGSVYAYGLPEIKMGYF